MGIFSSCGKKHLDGHKELTHHDTILDITDRVKRVYLPVVSPNLKNIEILVKEGDEVKVGTRIGTRTDFYVPIYSPVSGVVVASEMRFDANAGRPVNHVVIENDFKYAKEENVLTKVTLESSQEEIFAAIKEAGLVGLGGAGFPTYVKYNNPKGINSLLINAVECEPYLTTDYHAIKNDTAYLLKGAQLLVKALGAKEAVIAFKVHKEDMKAKILELLPQYEGIRIVEVPDMYPMGWERTLVKQVFGKEYKVLPSEVGVVVNNAQTVISLGHALLDGEVLNKRIVTVSGDGVANPCNVICPIGTPAKELIEACGGYVGDVINLIPGGPMCGKAVVKEDFPLAPQNDALTVLQYVKYDQQACLRCGECTMHCPAGLQPVEIQIAVKKGDVDRMLALQAKSCVECGMCSYVCPSHIDVTDNMRKAKLQIRVKEMKAAAAKK